jgi:hypothetical protein
MLSFPLLVHKKISIFEYLPCQPLDRHRRDDEYLVGLTTTYAISAYHHDRCDFEPR